MLLKCMVRDQLYMFNEYGRRVFFGRVIVFYKRCGSLKCCFFIWLYNFFIVLIVLYWVGFFFDIIFQDSVVMFRQLKLCFNVVVVCFFSLFYLRFFYFSLLYNNWLGILLLFFFYICVVQWSCSVVSLILLLLVWLYFRILCQWICVFICDVN